MNPHRCHQETFSRWRGFLLFFVCAAVFLTFSASGPSASAEDIVIPKVLTTVSSTPVALVDPSLITVSTSSDGCSLVSATFYDAAGNVATGAFNIETYRLEIVIAAVSGYVFDPNVNCYINNSAVSSTVGGGGTTVTLSREYTAAVWAPTVYKQPGAETVNEGSYATFVVSGGYVRDYEWVLLDPSESSVTKISDISSIYPQVNASGDGSTKLILNNIPYALNGWKVACNLIGAGNNNVTRTQGAILTVIQDPTRATPKPSSTPTPTPTPTPASAAGTTPMNLPVTSAEASAVGEAAEEPEESPAVHEHDFSGQWFYDVERHWHECPEDGVRGDEGEHIFDWEEVTPATVSSEGEETAECPVCHVRVVRTIPKLQRAPLTMPGAKIAAVFLLVPADIALVAVHSAVFSRQTRRRKRRRKR